MVQLNPEGKTNTYGVDRDELHMLYAGLGSMSISGDRPDYDALLVQYRTLLAVATDFHIRVQQNLVSGRNRYAGVQEVTYFSTETAEVALMGFRTFVRQHMPHPSSDDSTKLRTSIAASLRGQSEDEHLSDEYFLATGAEQAILELEPLVQS